MQSDNITPGPPTVVWIWGVSLITIFLIACVIIHLAEIVLFINIVLLLGGVGTISYIGKMGYSSVLGILRELREYQLLRERCHTTHLKNELLSYKIELERQMPQLIKYALESGRDIEYDKLHLTLPESRTSQVVTASVSNTPAIPYVSIQDGIPEDKSLLGIHPEDGKLELVDPKRYQTVWFVGGSSTGKTNTVYGKVKDLVRLGAKLLVCDIHAYKVDSLTRKLERFPKISPVADTPKDIATAILLFIREFRRRRSGESYRDKWLLVADEVNATCNMVVKFTDEERREILEEFDLELKAKGDKLLTFFKMVVEICGYESRGYDMYGYFISQKAATLSWLRNAVMTVFAHRLLMKNEATLAANDDPVMTKKLLELPRGYTLVYGFDFDPMILRQPLYEGESA